MVCYFIMCSVVEVSPKKMDFSFQLKQNKWIQFRSIYNNKNEGIYHRITLHIVLA